MAKRKPHEKGGPPKVRTGPLDTDAYDIQVFKRHQEDDATGAAPWQVETGLWPKQARARMRSIIIAVAAAPPTRFSGGGMWEVMHGDMAGFFEARSRYSGKLYRVFCVLDEDPVTDSASGSRHGKNVLVIISAGCKKNQTAFKEAFYDELRGLRDEYLRRTPRSWLEASIKSEDGES